MKNTRITDTQAADTISTITEEKSVTTMPATLPGGNECIGTYSNQFLMEHILEIIGTVVGILYLWLEYRASIYLWIAGIIMPAVYIFVYYDAGL